MSSKISNHLFIVTLFLTSYFIFDPHNINFSWMAFQERDFDKAVKFILGEKLSYLGPEISGGGYLPGPFLTLLYTIPTFIFKEPIGIFLFLQFCFVLNLIISFYLLKKYYSTELAWISFLIMMTSSSMYMYVFSAWHAAITPTLFLITLIAIDRAVSTFQSYWFYIIGIIYGISVQVHGSSFLFIILTLFLILTIKRKQTFKIILFILCGFFTTFTYYLIHDYNLDFENSVFLIERLTIKNNFNIQGSINLYDFLRIYLERTIFGYLNAFRDYYHAAVNGSNFYKLILFIGITKIIFLLIGLSSFIVSNKNKLLNYFQIIIILSPFLFFRHEARWFIYVHPFYEVIIGYGILQIIIFTNHYFKKIFNFRIIIIKFIPIYIFSTILFLILTPNTLKIVPGDSKKYSSFSIYYSPYYDHIKVRNFLLYELKLKPIDYKNKLHFYRGDYNWVFNTAYHLPSWAHYKYLFKNSNIKKPFNLGDNNIIIIPKHFKTSIDLTGLNIIQTKEYDEFKIIIYENSYVYKTMPLYSNFFEDESKIKNLKESKSEIFQSKNSITINFYAFIETHSKSPIKFINKLYLKNNEDGLEGFFEILGPTIRQSKFAEQAPHFIKNPSVVLKLKDGTSYKIELFTNNLYSKQNWAENWGVNIFYGKRNEIKHLGSLFQDAPHGTAIKLEKIDLSSINEIIFKIDGYGDILNYDTKMQKKTIKTQKEYIVKLRKN